MQKYENFSCVNSSFSSKIYKIIKIKRYNINYNEYQIIKQD